jgi:hypothetical protein
MLRLKREGVTGEMGGTWRRWKRERCVSLCLPKAIKCRDGHYFLGKNIATSNLPIWKWFCGGSATVHLAPNSLILSKIDPWQPGERNSAR